MTSKRVALSAGSTLNSSAAPMRHDDREDRDAPVEAEVGAESSGNRNRWRDAGQEACRPDRQHDAGDSSGHEEHGDLGDELPDESGAGGADGASHGQLALAIDGARQQHGRHVRARHGERESDQDEQYRQERGDARVARSLAAVPTGAP